MGVNLGENLMPAIAGNNDKGFWEDVDINALNDELLAALGHSWHSLDPVIPAECHMKLVDFKLRAVQLLRQKLASADTFGVKDPRISRLLPFWQQVFDHLQLCVSYVIACRNPLSVAGSLAKRNSFDPQKTFYLWMEHQLSSLVHTKGERRVVVNYDSLLDDPLEQFTRIAKQLEFEFDGTSDAFEGYRSNFLEGSLRHTRFEPDDVLLDKAIPTPLVDLYRLLVALASDRLPADSDEANGAVDRCAHLWSAMAPTLAYLRVSEEKIGNLRQLISDRDNLVAAKTHDLLVTQRQVSEMAQAVAQRDEEIAALCHLRSEQEGLVAQFRRDALMREEQSANLSSQVAVQEQQLVARSEKIVQLDTRVETLAENLERRVEEVRLLRDAFERGEEQRALLNEEVGQWEVQVTRLKSEIELRENQVFSLTLELRKAQEEFAGQNKQNAMLTRLLSKQMSAIRSYKVQVAALNRSMHAQAEQSAALCQDASGQEEQIAALRLRIGSDAAEIEALKKSLTEWERQSIAFARNPARDRDVEALKQATAVFQSEIAILREDLRARDDQIAALSNLHTAIDGIADVLNFEQKHNGFIQ